MYSWTHAVADQTDLILRRNKVGVRNNNGVSLNDTGNTDACIILTIAVPLL